jgi:hypothetical protein
MLSPLLVAADLPAPAYVGTKSNWPHYETETLVYRNRTWNIPRQSTTPAWFGTYSYEEMGLKPGGPKLAIHR